MVAGPLIDLDFLYGDWIFIMGAVAQGIIAGFSGCVEFLLDCAIS